MKLIRALRFSSPVIAAFVGAGGKTTAIFQASRELLTANKDEPSFRTVFVTTSTHFGAWQSKLADQVWEINSTQDIQRLDKELPSGLVLLYSEEVNDRLVRLKPKLMEGVHRLAEEHNLPLLIEADGAHNRPLKAPAEHEPAIPDFVNAVVVVAGLSGLGKSLTDEWIHRPEKFSEITGLPIGASVTNRDLEKMLLSSEGGIKNIPSQARRIALLTQADTPDLQSQGKTIGESVQSEYQASIIASLGRANEGIPNNGEILLNEVAEIHAVIERTGGVILAAGSSSRFGAPKQLLPWRGEAFIRHVARSAITAGLAPVVVVVGSSSAEVISAIKDLPVRIVNNSSWMDGMNTSVKAGLEGMQGEVGGVVFLQADQPQIPSTLIKSLVEAHRSSLNPIIAPQIDGQRGNPVLFDADTIQKLFTIEGDMGGRALFSLYPVEWVTWHDPKLLLDIDSPEDYRTFLRMYPESEAQV